MKKIFLRCFILVLSLVFIAISVSCSCGGDSDDVSNPALKKSVFDGGVHQYDYTETSDYLLQNGSTDYKIVISAASGKKVLIAAQELQLFFEEATGVKLQILSDSQVPFSYSSKVICIGNNSYADNVSEELQTENLNLGYEGFVIRTFGKGIYIKGNTDVAALYGTYCFLNIEFNCEFFTGDCYYIDKNVSELSLKNYNVLDIPDVKVRANPAQWLGNGELGTYRMRFDLKSEASDYKLGPETGAHTWNLRLSEETDYANHPKWYSTNHNHMCYNAQGDAEEYELLIQRLTDVVKSYFVSYPKGYIFTLGHGDEMTWCTCNACVHDQAVYNGSRIAAGIKLLNEVAKRVDDWLATEEGKPYDREYYMLLLSYGMTLQPPVKKDNDGNWVAIDDSVKCYKRVVPWYAPLEIDYQLELFDKGNSQFLDYFNGWMALSDKIANYTYFGNFYHVMTPVDMLQNLQQYYQMMAKGNCIYQNEDAISNSGSMTGWHIFRTFLVSRLGWNVNADVNELCKKFFKNYYAEASDTMLEFFMNYRAFAAHQEANLFTTHGIYSNVTIKDYWPKNLLDEWLVLVNEAVKNIEFYKYVDSTLYQKYYDHITSERVALQYLIVELYGDTYNDDYLLQIKKQCKEDCTRLGIYKIYSNTGKSMSEIFVKWGV